MITLESNKSVKDLPDHRQGGKVIYPLDEILLLCLLAVLGGADTFIDIALIPDDLVTRKTTPARADLARVVDVP